LTLNKDIKMEKGINFAIASGLAILGGLGA
jgi:hypothetical protein